MARMKSTRLPQRAAPRLGLAVALAALVVLASGCASMSEEQCKVADWHRVGLDDGAAGESPSRIASYSEDCAKAGVRPNPDAWRAGYAVGLQSFCTAHGGWRAGTAGASDKGSRCTGLPRDAEYRRYFAAGMEVYRTEQRLKQSTDESRRLEREIGRSKDDAQVRSMRARLRDLDREQAYLRGVLAGQQSAAPR